MLLCSKALIRRTEATGAPPGVGTSQPDFVLYFILKHCCTSVPSAFKAFGHFLCCCFVFSFFLHYFKKALCTSSISALHLLWTFSL